VRRRGSPTAHFPTDAENPHGVRDPLAGVVEVTARDGLGVARTVWARVRVVAAANAGIYPEFAIARHRRPKLDGPVKWSRTPVR